MGLHRVFGRDTSTGGLGTRDFLLLISLLLPWEVHSIPSSIPCRGRNYGPLGNNGLRKYRRKPTALYLSWRT